MENKDFKLYFIIFEIFILTNIYLERESEREDENSKIPHFILTQYVVGVSV